MPNTLIDTRGAAFMRTGGELARLALARWARAAAPAAVNVGFFTETKPDHDRQGRGLVRGRRQGKMNWIEIGSGAEINTAIAAGSFDIGLGIGSSPTAAGIAQGMPLQADRHGGQYRPGRGDDGPHRRQHQDAGGFQGQEGRDAVRLDLPFPPARLPEDQRPDASAT